MMWTIWYLQNDQACKKEEATEISARERKSLSWGELKGEESNREAI